MLGLGVCAWVLRCGDEGCTKAEILKAEMLKWGAFYAPFLVLGSEFQVVSAGSAARREVFAIIVLSQWSTSSAGVGA